MVYTFARVNAVIEMKVKDYFVQGRRGWVRLHEKGGKEHEVPCHHSWNSSLTNTSPPPASPSNPDGPLFRTTGRKTGQPQRHVAAGRLPHDPAPRGGAGIKTKIGNHTFRATGITAYLKNNGTLEHAQTIANHASPRTTKLYDRRSDEISLDEVERILI